MSDRLQKFYASEVERRLEQLFATAPRIPGTGMAEVPVIGGRFFTWDHHDHLIPQIVAALCCCERFAQSMPGWPVLPLHEKDIAAMKNAECPRCNLLGLFSASLEGVDWHFDEHPD